MAVAHPYWLSRTGAGTHPKGNAVYAHWMNPDLGNLNAKGVDGDQVKNVYLLKSGAELQFQKTWWGNNEHCNLFITAGSSPQKPVN